MISQQNQATPTSKAGPLPDETILGPGNQDDTVASELRRRQEAEITRLTWIVLDGSATPEQRRRLADLVSAQHTER